MPSCHHCLRAETLWRPSLTERERVNECEGVFTLPADTPVCVLPGAATCKGVVGTLLPPPSSSWAARNRGDSYIPRPKHTRGVEQVWWRLMNTELSTSGVCMCVWYLLERPAVRGQNVKLMSEAGGPPEVQTWTWWKDLPPEENWGDYRQTWCENLPRWSQHSHQ